jgi:pentatricopeptide repeat protein
MVVLEDSRCAHEQIIESRWDSKEFVGSSLVDMYTQGGGREEAWRVFHKMPSRNVVFWNSLLRMCHAWAW